MMKIINKFNVAFVTFVSDRIEIFLLRYCYTLTVSK